MNIKYQKVIELLNKYNQTHLLKYYDELTLEEKNSFLDQILSIDFNLMNNLYLESFEAKSENLDLISSMPYFDINELSTNEKNKYETIGLDSIRKNEYAVIIMAGGSGSRLGYNGPKGTYNIDFGSYKKTFFSIFIEQLLEFKSKYNIYLDLYLMTGKNNYQETIDYFFKNNYLNYPQNKIHFFIQEELPLLDTNGNYLLSNKNNILSGSNGNGDIFKAVKRANILSEMENKGIKWLFISGVDNILVKLIDPLFLGLTIFYNYKLSSKTIFKKEANSKDAVFALKNKRPYILNYWDITKEISNSKKDNRYLYRNINIVNHLISLDLITYFADCSLPYHRAFKKSNYIDETGNIVIPENSNTFKFEKFIFDAFSLTDKMLLFRVNEKDNFAPIKNKEGINSIETATKLYLESIKKDNH